MRGLGFIFLAAFALLGCDGEARVIEVIDAQAQPVVNAKVSISPGIDEPSSTATTDANGRATFAEGAWEAVAPAISIKVEKDNVVLHDAVRAKPEGSLIRIRTSAPSNATP